MKIFRSPSSQVTIRLRDCRTGEVRTERMPRSYVAARLHYHACRSPWLDLA